ncbi:MAG: cyclic pyranopterin monophosphate synthase MoaC [Rickettsiales bacterium]|nr:cyclic pyranopterin monophosphate synthase MoaC [Rickettsiales bacterium]|tara:strand:+ start:547 stop:1017 length:471 start_codon:yes stop_codon:yes gene_type:complete
MKNFTHIKDKKASMVDISKKKITFRESKASGKIKFSKKTYLHIKKHGSPKGEIFSTARIASIQATKKTSELIPMCHNIDLNYINIEFTFVEKDLSILIESSVKTNNTTGVEMEALTAVSIAALTIYDMCKSTDKSIKITDIKLTYKSGGKSGTFPK